MIKNNKIKKKGVAAMGKEVAGVAEPPHGRKKRKKNYGFWPLGVAEPPP
jgi:hypothetical protein